MKNKKITAIKETVPGKNRQFSTWVDESVLNFIDHNADEWGRTRTGHLNFLLAHYASGNFEAIEEAYNGPPNNGRKKGAL